MESPPIVLAGVPLTTGIHMRDSHTAYYRWRRICPNRRDDVYATGNLILIWFRWDTLSCR